MEATILSRQNVEFVMPKFYKGHVILGIDY